MISPQTTARITVATIDNPGLLAPAAALARSVQHEYTERRARIVVGCGKLVGSVMKLDPAASNPSEIGENRPLIFPMTSEQTKGVLDGKVTQH